MLTKPRCLETRPGALGALGNTTPFDRIPNVTADGHTSTSLWQEETSIGRVCFEAVPPRMALGGRVGARGGHTPEGPDGVCAGTPAYDAEHQKRGGMVGKVSACADTAAALTSPERDQTKFRMGIPARFRRCDKPTPAE